MEAMSPLRLLCLGCVGGGGGGVVNSQNARSYLFSSHFPLLLVATQLNVDINALHYNFTFSSNTSNYNATGYDV